VVRLLEVGAHVSIIDNLCNSSRVVLERIAPLCPAANDEIAVEAAATTTTTPTTVKKKAQQQQKKKKQKRLTFYDADLCDRTAVQQLFESNSFDAVIHAAGLKAVGTSCREPLDYYRVNLDSALVLFECMRAHNVRTLVFSSSATVYRESKTGTVSEGDPLGASNPYGRTKLVIEWMLRDVAASEPTQWHMALLRYFNPIGAHPSGLIGESPVGPPNNLVPFVAQVASGARAQVSVFGSDYETKDGTGVRDYIHVCDLANGHLAALNRLFEAAAADTKAAEEQKHPSEAHGVDVFNLGTGNGASVLEIIKFMEQACGKKIKTVMAPRRAGDLPKLLASTKRAHTVLGWTPEYSVKQAIEHSWNWQKQNPKGFVDAADNEAKE
jgi:UDP-glucose 4-epimerase